VAPVSIEFSHPAPFEIQLDPWPFDSSSIKADMECRVVPAERFANVDAFREAYRTARVERLTLSVSAK
jgi:hypothetical protein